MHPAWLDKYKAGWIVDIAVTIILAGLHHPASATPGNGDGLPTRLLTLNAVTAASRPQLSVHRRRLALHADRRALRQFGSEGRLGRGARDVAAHADAGQLELHTVPE